MAVENGNDAFAVDFRRYLLRTSNTFRRRATSVLAAMDLFRYIRQGTLLHAEMERRFASALSELTPDGPALLFPNLSLGPRAYFSKNVFSIFSLSLLQHLSIPSKRLIEYGLIIHAVRGIVTASDNILDKENNGAVFLASSRSPVLPNVGLIILQQTLLFKIVYGLFADESNRAEAMRRLFEELFAVGTQEMGEETGVKTALPPDAIISSVHHFKGGKLLSLPFVIPFFLETELTEPIGVMRKGMYDIGMALQILDDIVDLADDVIRGRHNLLRSMVVHEGLDGALSNEDLAKACESGTCDGPKQFPKTTARAIELSMHSVKSGIARFQATGYPINASASHLLLKFLFKTRNLWFLWKEFAQKKV